MKSRLFIYLANVFIIGLLSLGCGKDDIQKKNKPVFSLEKPDNIPAENYEIYSLAINEKILSENIVIEQQSQPHKYLSFHNNYFLTNYPDFDINLIQIHEIINDNSVLFGNQFQSDTKSISIMSSKEVSYIFDSQESDYIEFQKEYPNFNGIISFSRIAFNTNKDQAIFAMTLGIGNVGIEDYIVYLKKINDKWTIVEIFTAGMA